MFPENKPKHRILVENTLLDLKKKEKSLKKIKKEIRLLKM